MTTAALRSSAAIPIVVVDDEELHRRLITRHLAQCGVVNPILQAGTGGDAIASISAALSEPEGSSSILVLLDWSLPDLGGEEVLAQLEKSHLMDQCVVFVVTSSSRPDDRRMAYNHRIAGYVVKRDMSCYQSVGKLVADYLQTVDFPS